MQATPLGSLDIAAICEGIGMPEVSIIFLAASGSTNKRLPAASASFFLISCCLTGAGPCEVRFDKPHGV